MLGRMDPNRWYEVVHDIHELLRNRTADERIAAVASRLGGAIDRHQLAALGLGRGAIDHRRATGRLRPVHRGVYAVGHDALPARGVLCAALLASGPRCALSGRSAGALWRFTPSMPRFVEIASARRVTSGVPGIVRHQVRGLDAVLLHGLPVTSPARTLRDLAAVLPPAELERACSEALIARRVTPAQLAAESGPGSAALRRLVADGAAPTESELERRMLRLVRAAGLPRPRTQAWIAGHRCDFLWPEQRVVAETDGHAFHGNRIARERDHGADATLQLAGYLVLRFSWREVVEEPARVAGRLAEALSARASRRAA
jgi:very-short-patch-repair endonuclease